MSTEIYNSTPMPDRLTLINVAGICHGPQDYARSIIHDKVADYISTARIDTHIIFVPSTNVRKDKDIKEVKGVQMPLSRQLDLLHDAIEKADKASSTPVALAHSTASIATMAALRDQSLPFAVFVSPMFLDPRMECLGSRRFSSRLTVERLANGDIEMAMHPRKMSYSTLFPNDHFDDPLYQDTVISRPKGLRELEELIEKRARIFIGQRDWNVFSGWYPKLFDAEIVEKEEHSFEKNPQSPKKVSDAILSLIGLIQGAKQQ